MAWDHFERMATAYDGARPPYPDALYAALAEAGVIGPGRRVLEIGAGSGLATAELVRRGTEVVALEPGAELAALLARALPGVETVVARLEDADLPERAFDAVVAATALHWVDLGPTLPRLHAALRPGGRLAVWRTVFGDEVRTDFRDRVEAIVAARGAPAQPDRELRPTVAELSVGGMFTAGRSEVWHWSVELDAGQVRRLFATFSDWSPGEVEAAGRAVEELGGTVTEHYRTVLHLLQRVDG